MTSLQDLADAAQRAQGQSVISTAGWIMPAGIRFTAAIATPAEIDALAIKTGAPRHTAALTVIESGWATVYMPPCNPASTDEALKWIELLRHELAHVTGHWDALHRVKGMNDMLTSCLTARCETRLVGLHADLVRVIERASHDASIQFIVTCGLRTLEQQRALFDMGKSQTMNSRHLTGHAVDLAALSAGQVTWQWPAYEELAEVVKRAAANEDVPLTWGGDWAFKDGCHFELPRESYPDAIA